MDNNDAKALRSRPGPQWDVSQTAFNSAGALREIIRAVSYDDVQPQALLAAEALGLGLLVSPTRINEAIVALDGEQSVKWDRFKVVIGLQCKGTVKAIRNSTALTQFFLVATACKLCYTDAELGDVFFDIIAESGVLSLFPVSSSQLSRLIGVVSGHCDRILPVNPMHELAVAVDACSRNAAFYQRMENSELAKLICKVFEHLRDDSVEYVSLTGCLSGMWLATAFLWLLPERTAILVDDQTVKGVHLARLIINLTKHDSDLTSDDARAWKILAWRSDGDPKTFVLESKEEMQVRQVSEIPIRQAKSYLYNSHELEHLDPYGTKRRDTINAIGELAQTLITHMTENGTVYLSEDHDAKYPTALINLQKEEWIGSYTSSIVCYGWDEETSSLDFESSALEAIKDMFSEREPLPLDQLVSRLKSWLRARWGRSNIDSSPATVRAAVNVAVHAISSSLCNVQAGNLKLGLPADPWPSPGSHSLFFQLGSKTGLGLQDLRRLVFSRVFPYASPSSHDLAICHDGLVAGWAVLWEKTTLQRGALQLNVLRGTIEREGFRYERITEPRIPREMGGSTCHTKAPLSWFWAGRYMDLSIEPEKIHVSTKYICSTVGNTLELMTRLHCRDEFGREDRQSVSWIYALNALAVATHIDRTSVISGVQKETIARTLHNKNLEACWASVCHNTSSFGREDNLVLRTQGNEELRFWAAALFVSRRMGSSGPSSLFVRHSGPLISSLDIASKESGHWTIIC